MIIPQYLEGGTRIRRYSNEGYYIRQIETGIIYEDAVDVVPCRYTYEETDEKIPVIEPDNELTPEEEEELNASIEQLSEI